jgi:hypothetical protein
MKPLALSKRGWTMTTVLAAALVLWAGAPLSAQDEQEIPEVDLPVLLTSCGQSPGPTRVRFFLSRLDMEHDFLPQATVADLNEGVDGTPFESLIIVTGASLKGMGAAGVSMQEELARTRDLIAKARDRDIPVVCAHVEGMARRAQGAAAGDNSDEQSIDAVCPNADLMLVRADGNEDRRFSIISENERIPLILFEKNMEMGDVLQRIFGS